MSTHTTAESRVICADNVTLKATIYRPLHDIKGAILIGPATGIKRQFYAHFSKFLAENGYGVITFDNRGIGESLNGHINECDASLQCWGEKDMPAVFEELKRTFPKVKYHLFGHSAGGQLVGLMHNAMELTSIFNVACSSGQLKNMKKMSIIKAHFFMNIFIPLSNLFFGHTKSQWFGMGEQLPKPAAAQWRSWCNGEGYVKVAFGKTIHTHLYNELSIPSLWINAVDDEIAIDENVSDMISVFSKLETETLTLSAEDYGLKEIGHMNFFSRRSKVLWKYALDWLEKY